jgi:hypothetical protein
LIQRSRQADRDDIHMKDAICALLGIRTTALKGDGFTAYLPDMKRFATIIDRIDRADIADEWSSEWLFHVSGEDIAGKCWRLGRRWRRMRRRTMRLFRCARLDSRDSLASARASSRGFFTRPIHDRPRLSACHICASACAGMHSAINRTHNAATADGNACDFFNWQPLPDTQALL